MSQIPIRCKSCEKLCLVEECTDGTCRECRRFQYFDMLSSDYEVSTPCYNTGCRGHFEQREDSDLFVCDKCGLVQSEPGPSTGFDFRIKPAQKKRIR